MNGSSAIWATPGCSACCVDTFWTCTCVCARSRGWAVKAQEWLSWSGTRGMAARRLPSMSSRRSSASGRGSSAGRSGPSGGVGTARSRWEDTGGRHRGKAWSSSRSDDRSPPSARCRTTDPFRIHIRAVGGRFGSIGTWDGPRAGVREAGVPRRLSSPGLGEEYAKGGKDAAGDACGAWPCRAGRRSPRVPWSRFLRPTPACCGCPFRCAVVRVQAGAGVAVRPGAVRAAAAPPPGPAMPGSVVAGSGSGAQVRAQASRVRSSRRMILPVLVFGTSSTNCTARGAL